MVVLGAARHVAVKGQAQVRRSVVPAHGPVRGVGDVHFGQQFFVAPDHGGEVHHLAQADDARPGQRLGHVVGTDGGARRLEARRGRDAGRHLHPNVDGLFGGFVGHQLDTLQTEDVGDLVRVNEHAGCAARRDSAYELGDGDHARLDVHVTIQQAGDEVAAARVEDDRVLPDRVAGVRPNVGDVTVHDSDIRPVNDLARLDADPLSLADDEIGVGAAHGNVYEGTGEFCG